MVLVLNNAKINRCIGVCMSLSLHKKCTESRGMRTVRFKSQSRRQDGDRVAIAGRDTGHLCLPVGTLLYVILLIVISIVLAVSILHRKCLCIISWPHVELLSKT